MPGPPPKPAALRDIGPRKHRKKNKKEPKVPSGMPTCPRWLDGIGKYFFKEIGEILVGIKVLTLADKKALEILADAYSEYRRARAVVLEHGSTYEGYKVDKDGNSFLTMVRIRPEVQIAQNAWEKCFKGLKDFGLTPASRTKVEILSKTEEKDPLAEFQAAGRKLEAVKGRKGRK